MEDEMTTHAEIFEEMEIEDNIDKWSRNNWAGTVFERYFILGPKQKGSCGELYVEGFMRISGSSVSPPTNTGHDRIIDDHKTEIKFSLASSNTKKDGKLIDKDSFTFNHIAVYKDWKRFIFFGINPNKNNLNIRDKDKNVPEIRAYFMTKKSFVKHMKRNGRYCDVFKPQQGGKKSENDDYIVAGNIEKLIALPFVKPISQW